MTALAFMSRWLLSGGWRYVAFAGVILSIGLFSHHYNGLKTRAAEAAALEQQLATHERRDSEILNRLVQAEQRRGAAEAALSAWQSYKSVTLDTVRENGRNAPASTNPACFPSADERRLRNAAVRQLLGPVEARTGNGMPAAARTPD